MKGSFIEARAEVYQHSADWMKLDSSKQNVYLFDTFLLLFLSFLPPTFELALLRSIIVIIHSFILLHCKSFMCNGKETGI